MIIHRIVQKLSEAIKKLKNDASILITWFKNNDLKLNEDKCKFLTVSKNNDSTSLQVGNETSKSSEKLLGFTIDKNLTFNKHVTNLCNKPSNKYYALARISNYMSQQQLNIIMKALVTSQFGYCKLVWMFHNRKLNDKINKLYERSLRLVHNDRISSFNELLIIVLTSIKEIYKF